MNIKNHDEIENKLDKAELAKRKRKKQNMRVSGAKVKILSRIIKEKNEKK